MSTRFLTDPKIEQLGERHGPIGPLVIVALLGEAGIQEKAGEVEATFRSLSHSTFSDAETIRSVLDSAIELGLCHAESRDVTGCLLMFPAWERHQANYRQQKSRSKRKAAENPHGKAKVTDGHAESRDVTNKTGQDKTRKSNNSARESEPIPDKWAKVVQALDRVSFSRTLPPPAVAAVVKACETFPDRNHLREIGKFEHYYTDGEGQNRGVKDVVARWRNWLDNSPPAGVSRAARGARSTVGTDLAALEAEHAEAKAAEEAEALA